MQVLARPAVECPVIRPAIELSVLSGAA